MFEIMLDSNIQLDKTNSKSNFLKINTIKESINSLYLSKVLNKKSVLNVRNGIIQISNDVLRNIEFSSNDISKKLSNVINNRVIDIKVDKSSNLMLGGKIHVRDNKYTKFSKEFKTTDEMKQFCGFIDDLYFLNESIGRTFKCKLSKTGNLKFYSSSRKQINKDNIKSYFFDVYNQYDKKLNALKIDSEQMEKSIYKLETELSSKQLSNDRLHTKVEEFTLCNNSLKNALKYYFIKKDDSIYRKAKKYFDRNNTMLDNEVFNQILSSTGDDGNSSVQNNKKEKRILLNLSEDMAEIKKNIEILVQQVNEEQLKKRKLSKRYNTLRKAYKKVINNEETLKYVLEKIKENSRSIFGILKYRKQIIKDLKIYGFKIAAA